ncbi:MAG: SOUL heme-binding protein [Monoraphidium minutum]|nr:MAG: SOUL heme-binding protein [Monoraphidium minutum]
MLHTRHQTARAGSRGSTARSAPRTAAPCRAQSKDGSDAPAAAGKKERELGLGLKAAWFGAELFGNAAAALGGAKPAPAAAAAAPGAPPPPARAVDDVLASIRADYELDYFISGAAPMDAYADDCRYSDDFAAFGGPGATRRFKQNVANLGGLLSEVRIDVDSDWKVVDSRVTTNWRFQGIVKGLPWRPLLAAAGSTTHVIDADSGLVVEHIERWKADPGEVVARLLRPGRTPPGTAWETFMLSLSSGDLPGMWFVLSPRTMPVTALVCLGAVVSKLAAGSWQYLPGGGGAAVEVACAVLLPAAVVTEIVKFSGGLQGGETGTGGRF